MWESTTKSSFFPLKKKCWACTSAAIPWKNTKPCGEKHFGGDGGLYADEETGVSRVKDGEKVVVGGMLTAKTIKHTKTGKTMALVTLEDLVGTVEVVIFPRDYENNRNMLEEDSKVFIQGRVSTEDDRPSKLICERVQAFEDVPRELWIQFADLETFQNGEQALHDILRTSDGRDRVIIYLKKQRAVKRLTGNWDIHIDEDLVAKIGSRFGVENVKVVESLLKNLRKCIRMKTI